MRIDELARLRRARDLIARDYAQPLDVPAMARAALMAPSRSCEEVVERLRAGGAEVLQEPVRHFYGVIDCAFRDPSGNVIRFSEYLEG